MKLHGKTILITGAARGLGRQLALLLDALGCSLVLTDCATDSLSALAREVGNDPKIFSCDLGDLLERKNLIQAIKLQTQIDILINCAGIGSHSQLSQLTVDEIERVMQVNTLAPLQLVAGLSPLELVVNIGSVAGEMNLPSMSLYAASKTSVHAFTRSIQLEGARTLLVILGPLSGTDFAQSIAHPRTGQPNWYRQLDLPVETAARLIVQAMQRGKSQLVAPWWYRVVF
ncbi:MAG: SDR family NAD(P)-dependent oxidoreductase, partial [Anaerolineales bacterium]|nr:SDR family NAD(P)-dependent oxidoreductase [Anaerolineales bacterium]